MSWVVAQQADHCTCPPKSSLGLVTYSIQMVLTTPYSQGWVLEVPLSVRPVGRIFPGQGRGASDCEGPGGGQLVVMFSLRPPPTWLDQASGALSWSFQIFHSSSGVISLTPISKRLWYTQASFITIL